MEDLMRMLGVCPPPDYSTERVLFWFREPTRRYPNAVRIAAGYHLRTGYLECVPEYGDAGGTDAGDLAAELCARLEGFYFDTPDVLKALRAAGVDTAALGTLTPGGAR